MNISDAARELFSELSSNWEHTDAEDLLAAIESRLNTATAALTLELETVKRKLEHTQQYYASRLEPLKEWARKDLPEELKEQFFCIVANMVKAPCGENPPTLTIQLNLMRHERDQLRQQLAEAREESKRLDLLSKLAEHRVELFRNAAGRITLYVKDAPTDDDFVQAFAPTVRGAIDAAIKTLNPPTDEK